MKKITCPNCNIDFLKKNWILKSWWQRYRCFSCSKSFSYWWTRWSYSKEFKEKLVDLYCHKNYSAREIAKKYNVSTYSIVAWSKEHRMMCWCVK